MITLKSLGLTEANLVIQAGITRANEIGSPSTIAVVDAGGTIVAQPEWTAHRYRASR